MRSLIEDIKDVRFGSSVYLDAPVGIFCFCYLVHLVQIYFSVDFDNITLFESFDYCQVDTNLHNRFERSLPISCN